MTITFIRETMLIILLVLPIIVLAGDDSSIAPTIISSRYQDNGDGTVTDIQTHLMWKRCSEGQKWSGDSCTGEATRIAWNKAMPKGRQKRWKLFAGYRDWRVPTISELGSLVWCSNGTPTEEALSSSCYGKTIWGMSTGKIEKPSKEVFRSLLENARFQNPTINQIAFPNSPSTPGAATDLYDSEYSWIINFSMGKGLTMKRYLSKQDSIRPGWNYAPFRLVRGHKKSR